MSTISDFIVLLSAGGLVSAFLLPTAQDDQYPEFNLTTVQIIERYGYPTEIHTTETEDGYVIQIHRIPHGKNTTAIGFPVLVQHGLFSDSAEFVLAGPNSLAFLLSDAGHDVWLTNNRGNEYAKTHRTLSNKDNKFWDFSWHESGIYDIPAQIDYICGHTQKSSILYIGHSMGTTEFFVMASERPEYQKKVKASFMLAPVAYVKHITSPFRFIARPSLQIASEIFTHGQLLDQDPEYQKFSKVFCTPTGVNRLICKSIIFFFSGYDGNEIDERAITNFLAHGSGLSAKALVHYGQLARSGKFRQYDYGIVKNLAKYQQATPPEYKLEIIKTPMALFIGRNDAFVHPEDFVSLLRRLSCVKSIDVASYEKFSHLDFVLGKHAKEFILDKLLQRILEYLKQ